MMKIPDNLLCVFSAQIEERDDGAIVRIPQHEFELNTVEGGATYRIAILDSGRPTNKAAEGSQQARDSPPSRGHHEPPVKEGETVDVEIENLGDQGDGIARVERGFVIIVPDTDVAERVTVEITDVRKNVAFAEVTERHQPRVF